MIVASDFHLRESTEDTVFSVLDRVRELALADPDRRMVFCGDFWVVRYQVNVRLLNRVKSVLHACVSAGLLVDLVPGNHDLVLVNGENALEVLGEPVVTASFGFPHGVRVWTEPGVEDGLGFCPYRKDPTAQLEALKIASQGARVVFGHFGVRGSQMDGTRKDQDGLVVMPGGPLLILGHYHRHQQGTGFVYVGSPYQQSFGEVGNTPGVLQLHVDPGVGQNSRMMMPWQHIPLDIGPRYSVLTWDLDVSPEPPARPPTWRQGDHVRIDVQAAYSQLANPKLLKGLADVGLGEAAINILPREDKRDARLALIAGESLGQSAERFARSRLGELAGEDQEKRLTYLRRWAAEGVGE